jgi:hypothetical protein
MKAHRITAHAVALAAALVLASLAAAIDTAGAQSERRIPTRKGDVRTPVRTDTVVIRDTVRYRDTVVVRSDTVIREPMMVNPAGRFYWGLDGGLSFPTGDYGIAQNTGFTVGALVGWDAWAIPLGVRLDGGYTSFGDKDDALCPGGIVCPADRSPQLWHLNLDGKLRVPALFDAPFRVYGVGGATFNYFGGSTFIDEDDDVLVLSDDSWHSRWGWNLGGGIDFLFGSNRFFIESRYHSTSIEGAGASYVPLVIGITF